MEPYWQDRIELEGQIKALREENARLRQRVGELEQTAARIASEAACERLRAEAAEAKLEAWGRGLTARAEAAEGRVEELERDNAGYLQDRHSVLTFKARAEAAEAKADATIKLLATVTDDYDKAEAKLARVVEAAEQMVMAAGLAEPATRRYAAENLMAALAAAKGE